MSPRANNNCHFNSVSTAYKMDLPFNASLVKSLSSNQHEVRVFLIKKRKMENHHRIIPIQISLGSKFQLQQTILIFWNRFAPKKIFFRSKIEKMSVTTESFILELV